MDSVICIQCSRRSHLTVIRAKNLRMQCAVHSTIPLVSSTCNKQDFKPCVLIRPPDIVVGGLRFESNSSIFYLFSSAIPSELAERNSTKTGHMLGSECDLKMHVRNLGYPPTNRGHKSHLFLTTCNITTN